MRPLILEPFLHEGGDVFYNPLTGSRIESMDPGFAEIRGIWDGSIILPSVKSEVVDALQRDGWLVEDQGYDLARRFRLRVATLEASTICNQSCYFCPVSTDRRDTESMEMDFYESIVKQLSAYRETLQGVFMISYNEPTVDPRFLDQVQILKRHGLQPAVNSNGSGLTPKVTEALIAMGGLRFLSINLSTINRELYHKDRGRDHLPKVLNNIDYAANRPLAQEMHIAVLGNEDEQHAFEYEAIRSRFAGSHFVVKKYPIMNRAGHLKAGAKPMESNRPLGGCENLGSRPLEHIHINPRGECILCCQDYHGTYVLGNLRDSPLDAILRGDMAAKLRRMTYGLEEASESYLCRHCTFALTHAPKPGAAGTQSEESENLAQP